MKTCIRQMDYCIYPIPTVGSCKDNIKKYFHNLASLPDSPVDFYAHARVSVLVCV